MRAPAAPAKLVRPANGEAAGTPRSADDEFLSAWLPALHSIQRHQPEWIVLNAGVDGLKGDLLGGLRYTTAVHRRVIADLFPLARGRLIVVGGGGYPRKRAARGWCDVTAALMESRLEGS